MTDIESLLTGDRNHTEQFKGHQTNKPTNKQTNTYRPPTDKYKNIQHWYQSKCLSHSCSLTRRHWHYHPFHYWDGSALTLLLSVWWMHVIGWLWIIVTNPWEAEKIHHGKDGERVASALKTKQARAALWQSAVVHQHTHLTTTHYPLIII